MGKNEKTGKTVASIASKGLRTGLLNQRQIKTLSASALTQAPDKPRGLLSQRPKKRK
jgi:hypothetical protein